MYSNGTVVQVPGTVPVQFTFEYSIRDTVQYPLHIQYNTTGRYCITGTVLYLL